MNDQSPLPEYAETTKPAAEREPGIVAKTAGSGTVFEEPPAPEPEPAVLIETAATDVTKPEPPIVEAPAAVDSAAPDVPLATDETLPLPPTEPAAAPGFDLALPPALRGAAFVDAVWNWPTVARAAIALCDWLPSDPARLRQPLLPSRVALDEAGELQLTPVAANEATPFIAPELREGSPPATYSAKLTPNERAAVEMAAVETAAVYHVAALAYYLLADYPPVDNVTHIQKVAPDTPTALKSVLVRGLAVDPRQRIATLSDLRAQFHYVLVPPNWYEQSVARLPLDDENKGQLNDALNRLTLGWYRLRDRIPWQRLGRARRRFDAAAARPRVGRAFAIGGILLALLIYLTLVTNLI